MDHAFDYAIDNGMCLDESVPYTAKDGDCTSDVQDCKTVATFDYCMDVPANNELMLKSAVYQNPTSVSIEADTRTFQFYSSGILDSTSCGTTLDHGVLAVGYGEEGGQKYWTVKNSWDQIGAKKDIFVLLEVTARIHKESVALRWTRHLLLFNNHLRNENEAEKRMPPHKVSKKIILIGQSLKVA